VNPSVWKSSLINGFFRKEKTSDWQWFFFGINIFKHIWEIIFQKKNLTASHTVKFYRFTNFRNIWFSSSIGVQTKGLQICEPGTNLSTRAAGPGTDVKNRNRKIEISRATGTYYKYILDYFDKNKDMASLAPPSSQMSMIL